MPPPNSKHWETDPEYIKLANFLIERTKDAKSSMTVNQLARDFKESSGSSQQVLCLRDRIYIFRSRIYKMDSVDTGTKVRMLIALGGSIDEDFLNELQNDAHVEVDDYKRITKYIANDGSFEMEGDHSGSVKRKLGWDRRKQDMNESLNNSDFGLMDPILKTPRSVRRADADVPNSSKKTRTGFVKSKDHATDDSPKIPESRPREVVRRFSPQPPTPRIQQLRQPKPEGAPVATDVRTRQDAPTPSSPSNLNKDRTWCG